MLWCFGSGLFEKFYRINGGWNIVGACGDEGLGFVKLVSGEFEDWVAWFSLNRND